MYTTCGIYATESRTPPKWTKKLRKEIVGEGAKKRKGREGKTKDVAPMANVVDAFVRPVLL